jgi:hypothetical protein
MSKKKSEDQAFEWNARGYPRCRLYAGRQFWVTFGTKDEDVFKARRARLQAISGALTAKGLTDAALVIIRKAASAESNEAFEACCERAGNIVGHATGRERKRRWHTFEEFARAYYTGEIAREFPAHHKVKKTIKDDKGKLEFLSRIVGDVPLEQFTLEHAMLCMKKLPPTTKRDTTRNHYWQVMHRLLELAAFPAGLILANPLLREHRPEMTDDPVHYPFLYPHDDYRILNYRGDATSEGIRLDDICVQALFGAGCREAGRIGEFLRGLTWPGIDRVNGKINVGRRKNGRVGKWPAQPGTIETLLALREVVPGLGSLPGPFHGLPDDDKWSERLRKLCEVAGAREELYRPPGAGQAAIRAHDTRATFVTLSKAYDMPESWIMRRTGHEHSTMLAIYDHAKEDWIEQGLGMLVRLDVAIGRERLGLPALEPSDGPGPLTVRTGGGFPGGAIRLESTNDKTGHETESKFLVRNWVPEEWKSSRFLGVPKPGVEPGSPLGAADFESPTGMHEAARDELTSRNQAGPSDPGKHPVSSKTAPSRLAMAPAERLREALREARHAAVDADDDDAVAAIGALIKARRDVADRERFVAELTGTSSPETGAPASLDDARRRRRGDR